MNDILFEVDYVGLKIKFARDGSSWMSSVFKLGGSSINMYFDDEFREALSGKEILKFLQFLNKKTLNYFINKGKAVLEALAKVYFEGQYSKFNFELDRINFKSGFEFELGYYLSFDGGSDNDGTWYLKFDGIQLNGAFREQFQVVYIDMCDDPYGNYIVKIENRLITGVRREQV